MPATDEYDQAEIRARLEPWLAERYGAPVTIVSLSAPGSSGFSSETMLIDLIVGDAPVGDAPSPGIAEPTAGIAEPTAGTAEPTAGIAEPTAGTAEPTAGTDGRTERIVIRGEPLGFRVFPHYDLWLQYRCMDAVRTHSPVPMPELKWFESDPAILGHPFYVMERVDGDVPPDNLPYTIDGFLAAADPADQERCYRSAVHTLADLHAIDVDAAGLGFLHQPELGPTGLDQQLTYYERFVPFATDGQGHPVLDPALAWLRANQPTGLAEGLSWGDSRLGNMMFRDFETIAVFDWEMAALGPPEQDVAWFMYFVRFFSDVLGLPNLPGFPSEAEGLAYYEQVSGHTLEHLDWFLAWAAFRYAVVMVRLLHRPEVRDSTPAEWTLIDNPWTGGLASLIGLEVPAE